MDTAVKENNNCNCFLHEGQPFCILKCPHRPRNTPPRPWWTQKTLRISTLKDCLVFRACKLNNRQLKNHDKNNNVFLPTWGSTFLYSEVSSSTSKYTSEAVMDMVPFTASPGDTKIAVVLMFTGPKKRRKVAWVRSHIFPLNSIHRQNSNNLQFLTMLLILVRFNWQNCSSNHITLDLMQLCL